MRFLTISSFLSTYESVFFLLVVMRGVLGKLHIYLCNAVVIYDLFMSLSLEHMVLGRFRVFSLYDTYWKLNKILLSSLNLCCIIIGLCDRLDPKSNVTRLYAFWRSNTHLAAAICT